MEGCWLFNHCYRQASQELKDEIRNDEHALPRSLQQNYEKNEQNTEFSWIKPRECGAFESNAKDKEKIIKENSFNNWWAYDKHIKIKWERLQKRQCERIKKPDSFIFRQRPKDKKISSRYRIQNKKIKIR